MMRFRISHFSGPGRAAGAWLSFCALLGNILLPAGILSTADLLHQDGERAALCSAAPGPELPGKAKPVLLHHCALCVVPAAQPLHAPELAPSLEVGQTAQPLRLTMSAIVPPWHGRVRARAPPLFSA